MFNSRISVIVPAYNAEPFLEAALNSIMGQTRPPDQVIVVDDGSSDAGAKVARRIPGVELLRQENSGAAAARNRGIEAANGDLLAFLDADDLWPPEKLGCQLDCLAENPGLDMVFGMVRQFFSPDLPEEERRSLRCPEEAMVGYLPGTLLVRRSTFLQVGLFDPRLRAGEFLEWQGRAQGLGLISRVLPETLLLRRIHRDNFGRRERHLRQDYLRAVKASLDRRRKSGQG